MARLYLHGGPCDGQWIDPGDISGAPGTVPCGGATYYLHGSDGYYLTPAGGGGSGGGSGVDARQPAHAWHKLTHALGVDGPAAVRRSTAARKRLKRAVR